MYTEKDLAYLESATQEDYATKDRQWILEELLLRNKQMATALRREKESNRENISQLMKTVGVAGHFWNVCLEARRRYPNPRKTINIDEAMAQARAAYERELVGSDG